MDVERTLIMIKPEAFAKGKTGRIIDHFLTAGFVMVAARTVRLTRPEAMRFYAVHEKKPFYEPLTEFMSSGTIFAMVLEKEHAIEDARHLMGPTNPDEAPEGSIRALYGTNTRRNAVHGSDSQASAAIEIAFFFSELDLDR
ncbi:nucleoside-diphosphate kinase [bacterium]|nr:nucleoside-diphosphate kinase [candidate division CSSED10-310 bacterium]